MIELAVLALGRGPAFPAVGLIEDEAVFLPLQAGLDRLVLLRCCELAALPVRLR